MTAGFFGAFLTRAFETPDRVLFTIPGVDGPRDLTHGMLRAEGMRWAHHLRAAGTKPGAPVLIALPSGSDLLAAFLGALAAGCVPSFMPAPSAKQKPELFWPSHGPLFRRLRGGVIVTSASNARDIEIYLDDGPLVILTPEAAAPAPPAGVPLYEWHSGDIACLQHSSGTTGLKKGVMLSFASIGAQLDAYSAVLRLSSADRIVSWLPLYHDMGFVACFLMPLATGTPAVLIDPFTWLLDPLSLLELAGQCRATLMWLPNFAFNHLVNAAADQEPLANLASLRHVVDCSEPCRPASLDAFEQRFESWGLRPGVTATCYAMAETVFAVTQSLPDTKPRRVWLDRAALDLGGIVLAAPRRPEAIELVSSGVPLPGVELAILDADGSLAGVGRTGQIAIRAPFLFEGYHLEPGRSAAVFRDGFYLSGDLGFIEGQDLYVLGRQDDLIIVLGRNLFANEAENVLGAVTGLKAGRILVLGLDNADTGSQDLTIIAETNGVGHDDAEIRTAIRSRLDSILGVTPKKIVFVPQGWLIKSTSGKISRNANRTKYLEMLVRDRVSSGWPIPVRPASDKSGSDEGLGNE